MKKRLLFSLTAVLSAFSWTDDADLPILNVYVNRGNVTIDNDDFECLSQIASQIDKLDRRRTVNVNTSAEGLEHEAAKVAGLFRNHGFGDVNAAGFPGRFSFYPPGAHIPELQTCVTQPI